MFWNVYIFLNLNQVFFSEVKIRVSESDADKLFGSGLVTDMQVPDPHYKNNWPKKNANV